MLTEDRLPQTRRLRVAGVPDPALDARHQVRPVLAPGPIQRQELAVVPLALIITSASGAWSYDKAAICRVRCADQQPRGWRGGRDYDQGRTS